MPHEPFNPKWKSWKPKPGTRVIDKNGKRDIVESIPGMPEYDRNKFFVANKGFFLKRSGWRYREDWKPYYPPNKNPSTKELSAEELIELLL